MRWKGEDSDEEGQDEAENEKLPDEQKEEKKKKKNKKPAPKKKPNPKKAAKRANEAKKKREATGCIYKAGEYSKERKQFIDDLKASGVKYKEASEQWNNSERRLELLRDMPRSEQVRRRFAAPLGKKSQK